MAAHKSQLSESHDRGRQALSSWLVESGQSSDEHRLAARMLELPPSESSAYLPALIEMIKTDLQQQWQWGRQKLVESYLAALPELGPADAIPLELILAEFEARRRSGSPAAFAELAARFPRQAAALRQLIGQSEDTPTETVPENPGTAAPRPRRAPRSLAGVPKVPVKLPKEFGRYRIIKRLGRGAMGTVYLAHDAQLDRRVALKVPHFRIEGGARSPDRHDLDRFYREARTAATLDHPNLCPVFDVGQIDGIHYLSMAYIKGRPLSDYVDPDKPMPPRRVAAVVRKLALALEVAHAQGVVHRDLKPSNIMVNSRRELIIMDFGLAWRIGGSDERLTKTGMVLGTPSYMSPEQISGNPEALGPRCDVYSLGVIMYELLTASRPFEGPEAIVMGQILFIEPAPPSGHRPDLDPQIEAICLKAMAKRPGERYATMGELAADLDKYLRNRNLPPRPSSTVVALPEVPKAEGADVPESETQSQAIPPTEPGSASGGEPEQVQPLERPGTSVDLAILQESWRQWTVIVEIFALRRSNHHVDWQAYHKLHKKLIEACRARAAAVDETKRAFYRQLEDLVLPWLTPKALAQTDREILFSLLLFCRQAEQELGRQTSEPQGSDDRSSARTKWVLDMVIFVVVTIITGLLLRILITS